MLAVNMSTSELNSIPLSMAPPVLPSKPGDSPMGHSSHFSSTSSRCHWRRFVTAAYSVQVTARLVVHLRADSVDLQTLLQFSSPSTVDDNVARLQPHCTNVPRLRLQLHCTNVPRLELQPHVGRQCYTYVLRLLFAAVNALQYTVCKTQRVLL